MSIKVTGTETAKKTTAKKKQTKVEKEAAAAMATPEAQVAPTAPVAEVTATAKDEVAKAEAAMAAEAPVETPVAEDNGIVPGSKSHTISFVAALGDPSRIDTTQEEKGKAPRKDPTIVGYCFVSEEDIMVPDCGPHPDESFVDNAFSFDPKCVHNTRPVKAGEQFNLTRAEAALLISRDEYDAMFTGGSMPVRARYSKKTLKDSSGKPIQVEGEGAAPQYKVTISAISKGQSIKDIDMIPVLTFTTVANGKSTSYKRTIIPGFEKWSSLCAEKRSAGGAKGGTRVGGGAGAKRKRNQNAEEFLRAMMGDVMAAKKA